MATRGIKRIIELILDRNSAKKAERDMQEALDRGTNVRAVGRNLRQFGGFIESVGRQVAAAGAAIGGYVLAVTKLAERGQQVLAVQRAFAAASGDAEGAIIKLRKATGGLINDYDLMVNFNRAISLGAAQNVDDFGQLASVATDLGRALGIDATKAMEDLTIGIARGSKLILDNLGIVVDGAITVDNVMQAARERIELLGGSAGTAGNQIDRFKAQFVNLKDEVAKFVAESDTLRIAFFEASNLLETLVLALQSKDFETVKQAFKQVGAELGALFAASFFEALTGLIEKLFPNLTKLPSWVPLLGVFTSLRDITKQAADEGFRAAEAWHVANEALRKQLEAAAELRGLTGGGAGTRPPGGGQVVQVPTTDVAQRQMAAASGIAGIKLPSMEQMLTRTTQDSVTQESDFAKAFLDNFDTILNAAQLTAFGIQDAFQQGFEALIIEGEGLAGLFENLFKGIAGASIAALAEMATHKVAENVAAAVENLAKGLAAASNPLTAAAAGGYFAAAKTHGLAAAKWAIVGGGASAAANAVTGGGSRSSSFRGQDVTGRAVDRLDQAIPEINVYVDPFNPDNPKIVRVVHRAAMNGREQWGNIKPTYYPRNQ